MQRTFITLLILLCLWGIVQLGKYYYFRLNVQQGDHLPETIFKLKDGNEFRLDSLKGKYVLLHFWGSWCGPCRRENPMVRTLYQKFNQSSFKDGKGFEIVSIGIESDSLRWNNAIVADELNWKFHTSEFNSFDSQLARLYGVRQIPTLLLVGPDQRIILHAQSPEEIDKILTDKTIH